MSSGVLYTVSATATWRNNRRVVGKGLFCLIRGKVLWAVQVYSYIDHVGFVVGKVALGQVSTEYFGFPCQFAFHRLLHDHHLSSVAGTVDQTEAAVPSGFSLTPYEKIIIVRQSSASRGWTWKLRELQCWKPLSGYNQWRYSRLRRFHTCCSEMQRMWISLSTLVICIYLLQVRAGIA
jgi:hypothetical protein